MSSLSRERHQLDQRILLVAAAGRAVGETRRDLSRPALLNILKVRSRIHERFEGCRQAAHVGGCAHDDRVRAIEGAPPAGRFLGGDKLDARPTDCRRAPGDRFGDPLGVAISTVIDHDDLDRH
jgi:hypothetical protein